MSSISSLPHSGDNYDKNYNADIKKIVQGVLWLLYKQSGIRQVLILETADSHGMECSVGFQYFSTWGGPEFVLVSYK